MSSVVNKSKNKFAPKAKARPRPGSTAPAARASQEPSQTPERQTSLSRQPSSRPVSPVLQRQPSVAITDASESEKEGPERVPAGGRKDGEGLGWGSGPAVLPRSNSNEGAAVPRMAMMSAAENELPISRWRRDSQSASESETIPIPGRRVRRESAEAMPVPGQRARQASQEIPIPGARMRRSPEVRVEIPVREPPISGPAEEGAQELAAAGAEPFAELPPRQEGEDSTAAAIAAAAAAGPTQKARAPRKRKAAAKAKPRGKRRKANKETENGEEGEEGGDKDAEEQSGDDSEGSEYEGEREGEEGERRARKATGKGKTPKKKRRAKKSGPKKKPGRKKRGESPEGGEERRIEESVTKMSDLCRDPMIGRKSKRFVEIAQMDWTKIVREQRAAKAEMEARKAAGEDIHVETTEERLDRLAQENGAAARVAAPQVRIVEGQIVLDEQSLQIDRHQSDIVEESHRTMEVVEENRNTRLINSGTFSKREKVEKWDAESTNRFYEGLSMFGTDFELISRLFPGRSRRQMKNKFNSEERKDPKKITQALVTRIPLDMNEYSQIAGMTFNDPADLEVELQAIRDQQEAQDAAAKENAALVEKERQEQANAAMHEDAANALSAATEQPQKTRRNKKAEREAQRSNEQVMDMSIEQYEAMLQREREREEEERW